MKSNEEQEPLPSDDHILNTSHSSSTGTTGLGSYYLIQNEDEGKEGEMEEGKDELKSESCVDQGVDNSEAPRALYTSGSGIPPTYHTSLPTRKSQVRRSV